VRDGISSAGGSDELPKQALRERIIRHALGMPLNANDPVGITGPFHAFHGAIRGVSRDAKLFARLVGLMMAAIDERGGRSCQLSENASGTQNRIVLLIATFCSGREICSSMWNGLRSIGLNIGGVLNQ